MQPKPKTQSSDLSLDGLEGLLNSNTPAQDAAIAIDEQDWTVEETARALGLTRGAVIRRLEDGILTGYRIKRSFGWVWRVKPSWTESRKKSGPVATDSSHDLARSIDVADTTDSYSSSAGFSSLDSASSDSLEKAALENLAFISPIETLVESDLKQHDFSTDLNLPNCAETEGLDDSGEQNETAGNTLDCSGSSAQLNTESIDDSHSKELGSDKTRGYVEVFDVCEESLGAMSLSSESFKELVELKAKLQLTELRFQEANCKLDSAHQKIGYLEAKLESSQEQIKLLGDSQMPWWKKWQRMFRAQ
jgi:hypothetical protein